MKITGSLGTAIMAGLLAATCTSALAGDRVEQARERWGDHYAARVAYFIESNPEAPRGGTVFLGDSITEGMPLAQAFPGGWAINRGVGGDTIAGLRDRLDVSLAPLEPRRVILLIGINNLVPESRAPMAELEEQYGTLLAAISSEAPEARIDAVSLLPLAHSFAPAAPYAQDFNTVLRERIAPDHGADYMDAARVLAAPGGELRGPFTSDGIHLTLPGYAALFGPLVGPEHQLEALWNLRPQWRSLLAGTRRPDAIDPPAGATFPGGRGPDQLVVYTPEHHTETTGTNEWGTEVLVRSGTVVSAGGNDNAIPEDGLVLSGHGTAAQWLTTTVQPGSTVELADGELRITPPPLESLGDDDALTAVFLQYLRWLAAQPGGDPPPEAAEHLTTLMELLGADDPAGLETLRPIAARLTTR